MLFDKHGKHFRIKPVDNTAELNTAAPSIPCLERYTHAFAAAHLSFDRIEAVVHFIRTAFI
jgi:hypothetical protein